MLEFLTQLERGWGLALILWFQSWSTPFIEGLALIFHFLGSEAFILPLTAFIYWSVDKHLGRRLIPFLMFASWVNAVVKSGLQRPRPYHVSPAVRIKDFVAESSYGIPSGHSQNATTAGGIAAIELKRWWILGIGVAYAILTGISRMILGAHYPQDVIAGITIGLLMLTIYSVVSPRIEKWLPTQTIQSQIIGVVALVAVMAIIHPLLIKVTSPLWLEEAIPIPSLLDRPFLPLGVLLGAGIGLILEDRYLMFDWRGAWSKRIIRFALGSLGVLALYFGLGLLSRLPLPTLLVGLIRFGLIGFWVTFGAPWLFIKLGLAARTLKTDPYAKQ
jgi:membrane-associated phospholipid phosphatase